MQKILSIIKRKFWLLLFIFPSILIVNLINDSIYNLTMNSKIIFNFISYSSLFLITIFFIILYLTLDYLIKNNLIKKILKIIVILISIYFFVISGADYVLNGLFRHESCGKEFNDEYITQAKNNNSSFCLNNNIKLNSYHGFKGGKYCKTPNNDNIQINSDYYSAGCLTSFAQYTNDISHCNVIESNNLKISGFIAGDGNNGNKDNCIIEYAISKLDTNYCELLSDKGQDRDFCIKFISRNSKNKDICNKINNLSTRNDCLSE